jgi:hypothetical protein
MFPLRPIEGHVRRNRTTKPIPSLAAASLHAKQSAHWTLNRGFWTTNWTTGTKMVPKRAR